MENSVGARRENGDRLMEDVKLPIGGEREKGDLLKKKKKETREFHEQEMNKKREIRENQEGKCRISLKLQGGCANT